MKKILVVLSIVLIAALTAGCGCSKSKGKTDYGDLVDKASGTITIANDALTLDIKDIMADAGDDIDYTSGIEIAGEDRDSFVEIAVDASNVDTQVPGTYDVVYKITYEDKSYTQTSRVTVRPTPSTAQEETATAEEKEIESANIELLSGGRVNVKQTTKRFICQTYTDVSNVERDGKKYQISKLIVEFNTGEKKVLETIERPLFD